MLVRLTWQPDDIPTPETLTADIPGRRVREMRELLGTDEWKQSEAVMWIPCRVNDGPMKEMLFRLARILDVQPQ